MSKNITIPGSHMKGGIIQGDLCISLNDVLLFLHDTKDLNGHVTVIQTLEMLIEHFKSLRR